VAWVLLAREEAVTWSNPDVAVGLEDGVHITKIDGDDEELQQE
jgi:hypothetical protein